MARSVSSDTQIIYIDPQDRLISRTDLNGTILEANEAFIEISGYARDEIIGHPHNILRNQDVPKAIFKDLWQTIQSGKPWTQIVKNRTKDGKAYWVKANTAPIYNNNKISGYISIRKAATPAEIEVATQAYQKIEQGKLVIHGGRITPPKRHLNETKNPYLRLSLMGKLAFLGVSLLIAGTILTASLAQKGYIDASEANNSARQQVLHDTLNQTIEGIQNSALNTAIGLASMGEIRQSLESEKTNRLAKMALRYSLPKIEELQQQTLKVHLHKPDRTSFLRNWNKKSKDDLSHFRFSINQIAKDYQPVKVIELGRASIALRSISPVFSEDDESLYIGSLEVITSLVTLEQKLATSDLGYLAVLEPKSLEIAQKATQNPKFGDYHLATKGFNSSTLESLSQIDIAQLLSKGHLLDETFFYAAYPITDLRGQVIGHHILIETLDAIHALNSVSASNALNTVIKVFVAMFILILIFWLITYRNIVLPVRKMVSVINESSYQGDLSLRLDNRFNDELGQLANAYNDQMQNMQITMGEAGRMVNEVAQGNFNNQSSVPAKGDFSVLFKNVTDAVTTIDKTFNEIKQVLAHIRAGDFSYQPKAHLNGEYQIAMNDAQAAMAILRGVFFEVNELMAQVSKGHFMRRIEASADGELKILKDNINASLDKLQSAISETSQVMIAQGAGDMRKRILGDFEGTLAILKDGVNASATNMGSLLSQSNYSILKLSDGAKDIAQDISDLSARTQEQAASLEETAASMEQITSTIKNTADNAAMANQAASASIKEADQANAVVQNTISAINEISHASEKISEITSLIDSIAFQTNLLALNAAVEAARAGEHGRGFAVVAGEVRSLAGKASEAAKDIRSLIDDTLTKVTEGANKAQASGDALSVINRSIAKISEFVNEISQTTAEQAKGVDQVNIAIGSIDQVTQQNSALVDETAERTAEMGRLAEEVSAVSQTFTIDHHQISFDAAMKTGVFTFAHARRAHAQWKGIIHAVVEGMEIEFNREGASDHTKCALGKWFYGPEGQKFAHLAEMQEVEKWHIEVHSTIKQILQAHKIHDHETVSKGFKALDVCSQKVIDGLYAAEISVTQEMQKNNSQPLQRRTPKIKPAPPVIAPQKPKNKLTAPQPRPKKQPAGNDAPIKQIPAPSSTDNFGSGDDWGEF